MQMIKPDRVLALRADRIVCQYGGQCTKIYSRSHTCTEILLEAGCLAAAHEAGVRTPEFLEITRIEGKWALVTEFVQGKTLAQLLEAGIIDQDTCFRVLIKAQMEIQSAGAAHFRGQKDEARRSIACCAADENIKAYLKDTLEKLGDGNVLCHGNLLPENIMLPDNDAQSPVILDWKRACRGSADADAAAAWICLTLQYGKETAGRYLSLYCRERGASPDDIMRWVPVMAACRLGESVRRERKILLGLISEAMKNGRGGGCAI